MGNWAPKTNEQVLRLELSRADMQRRKLLTASKRLNRLLADGEHFAFNQHEPYYSRAMDAVRDLRAAIREAEGGE